MTVPAASAVQLTKPSKAANSSSDSAMVSMEGRTALVDISFTAVPLAPAKAGMHMCEEQLQPIVRTLC